jgi:hypothetical protein
MATPNNKRESLNTDLEKRYTNQHTGGAFDAKNIPPFDSNPVLETKYKKQSSLYVKGLDTTKYK